jgi:hypothetical protein
MMNSTYTGAEVKARFRAVAVIFNEPQAESKPTSWADKKIGNEERIVRARKAFLEYKPKLNNTTEVSITPDPEHPGKRSLTIAILLYEGVSFKWMFIIWFITAALAFFVSHNLDWEFILFISVAAFVADLIAWRPAYLALRWRWWFVFQVVIVTVLTIFVALVPYWVSLALFFFFEVFNGGIGFLGVTKVAEDAVYKRYKKDEDDKKTSAEAAEERAAEQEKKEAKDSTQK